MARPQLATAPATFELEPVTEEQPADDMAGVDTDDFEAFLAERRSRIAVELNRFLQQ